MGKGLATNTGLYVVSQCLLGQTFASRGASAKHSRGILSGIACCTDTLAVRQRRRPARPMGSPRVGSNPTGVVLPPGPNPQSGLVRPVSVGTMVQMRLIWAGVHDYNAKDFVLCHLARMPAVVFAESVIEDPPTHCQRCSVLGCGASLGAIKLGQRGVAGPNRTLLKRAR